VNSKVEGDALGRVLMLGARYKPGPPSFALNDGFEGMMNVLDRNAGFPDRFCGTGEDARAGGEFFFASSESTFLEAGSSASEAATSF
jgi:hypothetical protein